jgi:galactose-1-phosphate uridylyltransferase
MILLYVARFLQTKYILIDLLKCYLCPGNTRAQGDSNPKYTKPFVFVNDYSAVKEKQAEYKPAENSKGCVHLLFTSTLL